MPQNRALVGLSIFAGKTKAEAQSKKILFSLLVVFLFLTSFTSFSNSYGEQTSCRGREVQLRPLSSPNRDPEQGSGSVCYAEKSTDSWLITVKLSGLTPEEPYWLSINAGSPESWESKILGTFRAHGWPGGKFFGEEGYWDFKEITTDTQGKYEETITLPLPPGEYDVKFFIKKSYPKGGDVFLHNDSLSFEISESWSPWIIRGVIILVLAFAMFFVLRRSPKPLPAEQVPSHNPPTNTPTPVLVGEGAKPPLYEEPTPSPGPVGAEKYEAILGEVDKALDIYEEDSSPSELGREMGIICAPQGKMEEVVQDVLKYAQTDVKVLILGETGTGKELVAYALYKKSNRAGGEFLTLNIAAIPKEGNLLEDALFGRKADYPNKGDKERLGIFEAGNGGTVFLDEIGDTPPQVQPYLLRPIRESEVTRLGSNNATKVDFRLITATNVNIDEPIVRNEKGFRPDLYYRIAGATIKIPPLRDRREDILYLIDYFNEKFSLEGGSRVEFDDKTRTALVCYNWRGNIEELSNFFVSKCAPSAGKAYFGDLTPAIKDAYERYEQAGGQGGLIAAIEKTAIQFLGNFRALTPEQAMEKLRETQDELKQVFIQRGFLTKEKSDSLKGREAGIYSLFTTWLEGKERARKRLVRVVVDLRKDGYEVTANPEHQKLIDELLGMSYRNIEAEVKHALEESGFLVRRRRRADSPPSSERVQ